MEKRMAFMRLKRSTFVIVTVLLMMPFTALAFDRFQAPEPTAASTQQITPSPVKQSPTLFIYSDPVYIQLPGEDAYKNANQGVSVPEGSYLRTGETGRAEIRFGDGTVTRLDKNSSILVRTATNSPQQTVIELLEGRIWSRVKKLFGNESYSTVIDGLTATVRGTAFETRATENGGYNLVDEGVVEVACSPEETVVLTADRAAEANCESDEPITTSIVDTDTTQDEWVQFNKEQDRKDPRPPERVPQTEVTVVPSAGASPTVIPQKVAPQQPSVQSGGNGSINTNQNIQGTFTTSAPTIPTPTIVEQGTVNVVNDTVNTTVETVQNIVPTSPPIGANDEGDGDGNDDDKNKDKNKNKSNNGNANGREGGNGECNGKGNPNCKGKN